MNLSNDNKDDISPLMKEIEKYFEILKQNIINNIDKLKGTIFDEI